MLFMVSGWKEAKGGQNFTESNSAGRYNNQLRRHDMVEHFFLVGLSCSTVHNGEKVNPVSDNRHFALH